MLPVRDHLPTRLVPWVNYSLIAANVAAMGAEVAFEGSERWALVPSQLLAHPITLFTHMFLHANVAHLAGNMLFLWIFGDNVEDALGHLRYALFYLACGVAAALTETAVMPHSNAAMLGASGAIAGVLAAYGVLYPRSPITVLNPIPIMWIFWGLFLSLPAWVVILEFFAVNLYDAFTRGNGSGVAFAAHVGGFVAGFVLLRLMQKREPVEYDPWQRLLRSA